MPTTRPSCNHTIFPSKQPSNHPSSIPTLMTTNEPTNEPTIESAINTYCVNLKIFSNVHYYKVSENIDICKPLMWENDAEIASVNISIEDSTPVNMVNSMKDDLATI